LGYGFVTLGAMKKFIEIEQQQTQDEIDLGVPQEIIRVDVTDKSDSEIKKLKDDLVSLVKNPKSFIHECHHDEVPPKTCNRKEI
jgi:hypothetical protein